MKIQTFFLPTVAVSPISFWKATASLQQPKRVNGSAVLRYSGEGCLGLIRRMGVEIQHITQNRSR